MNIEHVFSSSADIGLSIYFVSFCPLAALDFLETCKNKIWEKINKHK